METKKCWYIPAGFKLCGCITAEAITYQCYNDDES